MRSFQERPDNPDDDELSTDGWRRVGKALKEYKEGVFVTDEEVRKNP